MHIHVRTCVCANLGRRDAMPRSSGRQDNQPMLSRRQGRRAKVTVGLGSGALVLFAVSKAANIAGQRDTINTTMNN